MHTARLFAGLSLFWGAEPGNPRAVYPQPPGWRRGRYEVIYGS
jgi:hypothetical protein